MALEFSTRSSLAVLLLELLAKGDLPATRVARLAAAAAEDGWLPHDPLAQDLAKAGEGAIHTGNCLRDIMKIAQKHGLRGPDGHTARGLQIIRICIQIIQGLPTTNTNNTKLKNNEYK